MAFKRQAEWLPVFGGRDEVFGRGCVTVDIGRYWPISANSDLKRPINNRLLVQRKTWHWNTFPGKRQVIKHGANRVRKVWPHTAAPFGITHGQPGR